jgi:glycosyltransferase involved in cell wall biosynthesis
MHEQHPYREIIPPVAGEVPRPLWSVMIPTYNCANYLRETLGSVLAQDPGSQVMQIQVVDDCSTEDDPAGVVEQLGGGRVEFYQQPQNVGYIKNFATCLQRSRGYLIHLLHGDDCVMDGFYAKMQALFEQYPQIGAGFCRQIIMDDWGHWQRFIPLEQNQSGILNNWLERIATELTLQTPAMVVRREVYEKLGAFDSRMKSCGEDWEMWVRIAAQYSIGYEVEPLVVYRDRSNSITKRSIRTGQNIRDVRMATQITRAYLPPNIAKQLSSKAGSSWADWAFYIAGQMIYRGDCVAAIAQIREGLLCSHNPQEITLAVWLLLKTIKKWLEQKLLGASLFKPKKTLHIKQ